MMLICETTIERAIDIFLSQAHIPWPEHWNQTLDEKWIKTRVVPAFLKALEAIEPIEHCHGFDASKIDVVAYRQ